MKHRILIIIALLVVIAAVASFLTARKARAPQDELTTITNTSTGATEENNLTEADLAGQELSAHRCTGTEKTKLSHLPMKMEDFSMILPYGLMIGGHVTPIDHQYFSPADYHSKINTYEVYAMADSRIVSIGTRPRTAEDGTEFFDYRIVFTISCRLLYYYDLVTSLAPDLQAAYDTQGSAIDFEVQAGQLIGYIGAQTLDFAVWDTDKPLTGFVDPIYYKAEGWKLYTADPLDYYTDDIKKQALSKYIRTQEPISGKIDYDIDGKLIGNWFQEASDGTTYGYGGGGQASDYWVTHLSFAPDYLDPRGFQISIGNWPGGASQFAAKGNQPDPAMVSVETGLVKYDLTDVQYKVGNQYWDRISLASPITFSPGNTTSGCALAELTDTQTLRFEAIPDTSCAQVNGFSDNALTYTR